MMKSFTKTLLLLLGIFISGSLSAQYVLTSGGRVIRAQEGALPYEGSISLYNHLDFNTISGAYGDGFGGVVPMWLIRNITAADYVLFENLQISAAALLYQDIHHLEKNSSILENLTFSFKYASLKLFGNNIYAGLLASVMLPIGSNVFNSWGNPYSAGGTEIGFMTIVSYYADELFPRESFSVTANLGYYNYMDEGKNISNNATPLNVVSGTTSINYNLAFRVPVSTIELMAELWGWYFLNSPPLQAYTRESLSFATVGLKIKPTESAALTLGIDYLLTSAADMTVYNNRFAIIPRPGASPVNYTQWRAIIGVQFNISNGVASLSNPYSQSYDDLSPETNLQGAAVLLRRLEDTYRQKDKAETLSSQSQNELERRRKELEQNLEQLRQILKQGEPAPQAPADSTQTPK